MRWFVLRLFADRPFSPDHLAKAIIGADRGHRGTAAINPCRTYSRVLALNGKTIDWRHNALRLGTKADRARFKGMNALSDWPRNRLLLALPSRNLKRLMPELEQIRCDGEQFGRNGVVPLAQFFFPAGAVV